jgi:hypothetical protein
MDIMAGGKSTSGAVAVVQFERPPGIIKFKILVHFLGHALHLIYRARRRYNTIYTV